MIKHVIYFVFLAMVYMLRERTDSLNKFFGQIILVYQVCVM